MTIPSRSARDERNNLLQCNYTIHLEDFNSDEHFKIRIWVLQPCDQPLDVGSINFSLHLRIDKAGRAYFTGPVIKIIQVFVEERTSDCIVHDPAFQPPTVVVLADVCNLGLASPLIHENLCHSSLELGDELLWTKDVAISNAGPSQEILQSIGPSVRWDGQSDDGMEPYRFNQVVFRIDLQ
ncbi:hypothetical protein Tco_0859607 [Tanacetum coccineum]|uniref:Uncharacterized protein n=1 Tax=Tanacetum coccineum TaxID=301880 RepID=A0ABQ5BCI9_9ASTR